MKITSPAFSDGEMIPKRFTADGGNVSPELDITAVPEEAKSLVLIVDDPDAPAGTWNHWLVWNIPAATRNIPEGSAPEGAVPGRNDFGEAGYLGPAPPSGVHRYYFRLFALDIVPDLPAGSARRALDLAMDGHVVAQAMLMGRYTRNR